MSDIQVQSVAHGGARQGAGRKSLEYYIRNDAKYLSGRGINPLLASEILARVVDERKLWQRILGSQDDRVVLDALKFLVQMRDGRPAQQINMTSTSISLSASDLERARAIVAEIRSSSHEPQVITSAQKGLSALDSAARLGEGGAK